MAEQDSSAKSTLSRRDFLKLLGAAGTGLAFAPYVPWGNFMPNPDTTSLEKAKVIRPDDSQANVNTFPVNHAEVITYPKTGDTVIDEEAFRKWQFIRLPSELGGDSNDVTAFRAYSMVCLHLWCLWKYWPEEGRKRGECPCHGSMYNPVTGTAFRGPASLQAPPSNTLARLTLEADADGFLWISPAKWNVNENGVVGYGRFIKS
ncbi:MAG TPA: twin-arginine translocation signal domain-containing protein [Nitrosopumilaceae archaeon]|nr:twin-arginine translocation signal domain-containing protein [Nitrosopumilaceae archaeon]